MSRRNGRRATRAKVLKPPPIDATEIAEDGQRFLLALPASTGQDRPFALVLDWPALIKKN